MPAKRKASVLRASGRSRGKLHMGHALSLEKMRPIVLKITRQYGVSNVRVFGSFVRGEQRPRSDLDLLVDLPDGMTLFDLSGLKIDLEEALKRKVDVISARSIKPMLRDHILSEARTL